MKDFTVYLQYLVPQRALSRALGWLSERQGGFLKNWAIRTFIKRYQVGMHEAILQDPSAYKTFNDFFTRALVSGARPMAGDDSTLISPADGVVSQFGKIDGNQLLQAKGFSFTLENLLGGDRDRSRPFLFGDFITIYLAPKDYHRVHMPYAGRLTEVLYIPGQLFSVNNQTASQVSNLFGRNERVVCFFETAQGPMAVILVGAMIVASIVISGLGVVAPHRPRAITSYHMDKPVNFERGSELGYFKLGSTVIVLLGRDVLKWRSDMSVGHHVRMGEVIANQ